jgi:hypothetical protein
MPKIFISHSRRDTKIRQHFDSFFASSTIQAIRVEFEDYAITPCEFIRRSVEGSKSLFLLLGTNVTCSLYTTNWISYEIGLATALHKDVWVFERYDANISFPVPTVDHYVQYSLKSHKDLALLRDIVAAYASEYGTSQLPPGMEVTCPSNTCRATFLAYCRRDAIMCPSCRSQTIRVC